MQSNVEFRAVRAGGEGRLALENVTVASRGAVSDAGTDANESG
jgi:hypothetical protein